MDTDITLPVRRTTGETLQDRLTDNAYHSILPARYLKKDADGNLIESQEELFERVAKNIAVAEAVHVDEEILIDGYHIKPFHPRRSELFEEVLNGFEDAQVPLSEENAKWVAYDRLMDDGNVSSEAKTRLEETMTSFRDAMEHLKFMPNSPTLMNAGNELQMLSACFVNSPSDDIRDIHEKAADAADIFQAGGGNGYAFSHLRPYGDSVGSTGGIASGPISFMRTFDTVCGTIAQGGKRRGAQMGVMRVTHPDIPYFIHAKNKDVSLAQSLKLNDPDDYTYTSFGEALEEARGLIDEEGRVPPHLRNAVEGHLSNFNISVAITDDFMEAAQNGDDYTLINPRTGDPHIATEETKELWGWFGLGEHVTVGEELSVPAEDILDRVAKGAHENGEPGVIFIDTVNEDHSYPVESTPEFQGGGDDDHQIYASNPCAEEFLEEGDACNLGHINLSTVVTEDAPDWREYSDRLHVEGAESIFDDDGQYLRNSVGEFLEEAIDWRELDDRVALGTRFLDNVVTMSAFPVEKIDRTVRNNRKIGLGIMGLAQMFIQLGVEYGSEAGNEIAREVMKYINQRSKEVSHDLAGERGCFTHWDDSKYSSPMDYPGWFKRQTGKQPAEWVDGYPLRNHNTTTIAPTGTTSMVGNTTGGCEPIYNVAYYKNVSDDVQGDEMLVEFDDYFLDVLRANDIDVEAVKEEAESQMSSNSFDGINSLSTVPDAIGELFITTDDLTPEEHASVQCALQEGVDSGISKTVNAPKEAPLEEIRDVIEYLWLNGAKGSTIYRDGTRSKQVLTTRADNTEFAGDVDDLSKEEAEEIVADLITEFDIDVEPSVETVLELDEPGEWDEEPIQAFNEEMKPEDFSLETFEERVGETQERFAEAGITPGDVDEAIEAVRGPQYAEKRERPDTLDSRTQRIETGYGSLYVTISEDQQGRPFELFTNIGNNGSTVASFTEAIAKVISISLRSGTDPEDLAETLQGIKSPKVAWDDGRQIHSIPDAIGVAMERWMEERERIEEVLEAASASLTDDNYGEEPDPDEWMEDDDDDEMAADGQGSPSEAAQELAESTGADPEAVQDEFDAAVEMSGAAGRSGDECPECHQMTLMVTEGCCTCTNCGFSKC